MSRFVDPKCGDDTVLVVVSKSPRCVVDWCRSGQLQHRSIAWLRLPPV